MYFFGTCDIFCLVSVICVFFLFDNKYSKVRRQVIRDRFGGGGDESNHRESSEWMDSIDTEELTQETVEQQLVRLFKFNIDKINKVLDNDPNVFYTKADLYAQELKKGKKNKIK